MSAVWSEMTDMQRAAALELMGGKRNANAVEALLQNFSIAEDSLKQASNSAGSAMSENDKCLNSIQGKVNQLHSSVQVFSNDLLDSGIVKFIVDFANGVVKAADGVVKLGGALPLIVSGITAVVTAMNTAKAGVSNSSIEGMGLAGQLMSKADIDKINLAKDSVDRYVCAIKDDARQTILTEAANKGLSKSFVDVIKNSGSSTDVTKDFVGALLEEKIALAASTAAHVARNAAISIGISLVVQGLIVGIQKLVKFAEDAVVTYDELKKTAADAKTEWDTEQTSIEEITGKMQELSAQKEALLKGNVVSQKELADIELENTRLEAQLKLAQELAAQKATEANNAALGVANTKNHTSTEQFTTGKTEGLDQETGYESEREHTYAKRITNTEYLDEEYRKLQDLDAALKQLDKDYNSGAISAQEFGDSQSDLKSQMSDTHNEIVDTYQDISDNFDTIIDDGSDAANQVTDDFKRATDTWLDFEKEFGNAADNISKAGDVVADGAGKAGDGAENAADAASNAINESWNAINSGIDGIQNAYNSLTNAMSEYNANGSLSMDTLQSLITLDDQYLACLVNQNGQLSLNMNAFQQVAMARLNEAKATAVEQAMAELHAIAQQGEATAAAGAMGALANKGSAVALLAAQYENLGNWAGFAAKAEALADSFKDAATVDPVAAGNVMKGLNAKLGLIDSTMAAIKSSASGAGKALGGFGNAAGGAGKQAGGAAPSVNKLTDALEKQKEVIEDQIKALEKEQNRLKIFGQAAIKEIEKRIDALKDAQDAQDDLYDSEIDNLNDTIDGYEDEIDAMKKAADAAEKAAKKAAKEQNKLFDSQIDAYEEQTDALDKQIDALDDEIDGINKQIDAINDQSDAISKQIDELNEKKKALQDANDEEDRAIKLAELQDALERAKNSRSVRVYQHDTGFEWGTNENNVQDAQNNLDDQQRNWNREDAVAAIDAEIEAREAEIAVLDEDIAKRKESIEAIEDHKDALQGNIDAIREEIDAVNKLKDAYNDEVDAAQEAADEELEAATAAIQQKIDAIQLEVEAVEQRKDAYDAAMDAEIAKLETLKDQYNEALSLIGTSWEDYQMQLEAAALFSGMTYEQMVGYHTSYKDAILANMQQVSVAEQALTNVENQLADANNNVASSAGGAGGGIGGIGGAAIQTTSALDDLITRIITLGDKNAELTERAAALQAVLDSGTASELVQAGASQELADVKAQIADNTTQLEDCTTQYIQTVAEETDATKEDRDTQIEMITQLMEKYGISYDNIALDLSDYVDNVVNTTTMNSEQFGTMTDTLDTYANTAKEKMEASSKAGKDYIDDLKGTASTNSEQYDDMTDDISQFSTDSSDKLTAAAKAGQDYATNIKGSFSGVGTAIDNLLTKIGDLVDGFKNAQEEKAKLFSGGVEGGNAIGSTSIRRSGVYRVDEQGPETYQRTSDDGKYTYFEKGDAVYTAAQTKNLWNFSSNPGGFFEKQYDKYFRKGADAVPVQSVGDSYKTSIGDIIIQNPVGSADDLANELARRFPNAMIQAANRR